MDDEKIPLDERVWTMPDEPAWIDWWFQMNMNQGFCTDGSVTAENVHIFFGESIFCEPNSSNKQFQALTATSEEASAKFFNRKIFEREIAQYSGVEYVVSEGPDRTTEGMNRVWAIRKQERTKMRGGGEDQVVVRGYYIVINAAIVQAPMLGDILQAKITSLQMHLSNFYRAAASIPYYSIDRGYYYLAPEKSEKRPGSIESVRSSRAGTPLAEPASQTGAGGKLHTKELQERNDDAEIAHSFALAMQYGDEYMDENPLIGEPGIFKLTTTTRQIREREEKKRREEAAREQRAADGQKLGAVGPASASPTSRSTPVPPPIKTQGLEGKGKGTGKARSPTAISPDGVKKRRKSRAPGTPGLASPSS